MFSSAIQPPVPLPPPQPPPPQNDAPIADIEEETTSPTSSPWEPLPSGPPFHIDFDAVHHLIKLTRQESRHHRFVLRSVHSQSPSAQVQEDSSPTLWLSQTQVLHLQREDMPQDHCTSHEPTLQSLQNFSHQLSQNVGFCIPISNLASTLEALPSPPPLPHQCLFLCQW